LRVEREFGFVVFTVGEGGLFGDAIDFAEGLAEQQVGEGALFAPLLKLETESLLTSPLRKGGNGCFQLFRGDGIEIV
jgi:hypothetical protein